MLSYTILGSCALMDIRTSQAMRHLKTLWTPCSSHLVCCRADSIVTWLLFLRSRHSSHILVCGKCRNWWRAQFPFRSGADSWPAVSERSKHNYAGHTWSYGVEVLCLFTDCEHEIRKPKHMWTDDELEPVQMMDTETRKVIAMMLVILEQMSRKFVYSR